jgi:hypothetical protein
LTITRRARTRMPEIRSIDQPDELAPTRGNLPPRPRALNRPDWRAGLNE